MLGERLKFMRPKAKPTSSGVKVAPYLGRRLTSRARLNRGQSVEFATALDQPKVICSTAQRLGNRCPALVPEP